MSLQIHPDRLNVFKQIFDSPIDIALLWLCIESQNVRSHLVSVFKEVPAMRRPHLNQEVPVLVLDLFLFLVLLCPLLLLLSLLMQMPFNMLLDICLHSYLLFPLESFQQYVVFDVLYNVGIDIPELLCCSQPLLFVIMVKVSFPNPHPLLTD